MLIRNAQEEPHADKQITVDVSLFLDDNGSLLFYKERHTLITNFMGVASMVIGEGTLLSGNLSNSPRFLKMEVDPEGGSNFSINFSEKLSSVPFSQFSEIALKIPPKSVDAVNIAPGTLPLSKLGFPYVSKDNLQNLEEILSSLPSNNGINNIDSIPDDFADYLSEWTTVPYVDINDIIFEGLSLGEYIKLNNTSFDLPKYHSNLTKIEPTAENRIKTCLDNFPFIPSTVKQFKGKLLALANCMTNYYDSLILNPSIKIYEIKETNILDEKGTLISNGLELTNVKYLNHQKGFRYVWGQKYPLKLQSARQVFANNQPNCIDQLYGMDCSGFVVWLIEKVMDIPLVKKFRNDTGYSNADLLSKTGDKLDEIGTLISLIKKWVNSDVKYSTYHLNYSQIQNFKLESGDFIFFKKNERCRYHHVGIVNIDKIGNIIISNANGSSFYNNCARNRGYNDDGTDYKVDPAGVRNAEPIWKKNYDFKIIRVFDGIIPNSNDPFECGKGFKDIINNEIYQTVKIGNQCWMKENLRSKKYQTGADIKEVYSFFEWGKLVYLNRSLSGAYINIPDGMFYNATAANDFRKICPSGWRLPTQNDWEILKKNGDVIFDESIGIKLKSATNYCNDSNISLSWEDAINNTNELNFDALPLGRINADGVPENRLKEALFWSTWENNYIYTRARAARLPLFSESPGMPLTSFRNNSVNIGANIRCIRGN